MPAPCPFCRPDIAEVMLWENAPYRIVADAYPLCVGHVLILSKAHYRSHMEAPLEQLGALEEAQGQVRRFLLATFGQAAFFEHGGLRQEVAHAHLHGLPFTLSALASGVATGLLRSVEGWEVVWQKCVRIGHYLFVETVEGPFLLARDDGYGALMQAIREQMVAQAAGQVDPASGRLKRGGREMVQETMRLWQAWARRAP